MTRREWRRGNRNGGYDDEEKAASERYLKWLNRYERIDDENEPIELILCAGGNHRERVELLEMNKGGIMVAEYWATLSPKAELEQKYMRYWLKCESGWNNGSCCRLEWMTFILVMRAKNKSVERKHST